MNANSHPIKTVSVADEGMYANNHPYKVVVEGGPGGNIGKVVDTLPEVGEPGFIYLVLKQTTSEGDIYDEYIWAQQPNESFAWEHLGATNEVTIQLYSTYGQNTDGAMTQKATTDLVYTGGDPTKINIGDNGVTGGTNSIIIGSEDSGTITGAADQIIIGHNITDGNANSIAIGNMASTGASAGGYYGNAIAIGHYAKATRYDTVAVGSGLSTEDSARATGDKSIAIGSGANSYGNYAVAIGKGSAGAYGLVIGGEGLFTAPTATGGTEGQAIKIGLAGEAYGRAVAIGLGTTAKNGSVTGAVAIGDAAEAIGQSTVALGAFAKPRAKGVVDVGISANSASAYDTAGYNNTRYRVISGVHDPDQAQDAATKNYVDTQVGNIETILQTLNSGTGV